jgi:hypothetical protein
LSGWFKGFSSKSLFFGEVTLWLNLSV